jgi:hypothetical protein
MKVLFIVRLAWVMLAATRMLAWPATVTAAGGYRRRVIDLVSRQGLEGLLLCNLGISLRVKVSLALFISGLGLVEDSKKLFTLSIES